MPGDEGRDMPMVIFEKGSPFDLTLYEGVGMVKPQAMISCTLDFIPLSDLTLTGYTAGNELFDMPDGYLPPTDVVTPVVVDMDGEYSTVMLTIHATGGYASVDKDISAGTLKTNGWSVNLCSVFYGEEVTQ